MTFLQPLSILYYKHHKYLVRLRSDMDDALAIGLDQIGAILRTTINNDVVDTG